MVSSDINIIYHILIGLFFCGYYKIAEGAGYGPGFFNHSGCLYAHVDDMGQYLIKGPEIELQVGNLKGLVFDDVSSNCTNPPYPGNLVFSFNTNDNFMNTMTLEFSIKPSLSAGYWEINKAILKINPVNRKLYPSDTYDLKLNDYYAANNFSYSCQSLILKNSLPREISIELRLKRFQLQPFHEPEYVVFAPSFDCAVWITLPQISGLILLLFMIFTVIIGVNLIADQGNQNGDLKFSKQGGMLLNQAQLDATKG